MSIFSKIGGAIKSGFKAIGHGLAEVGKQVGLFAEGVVSGFVLKPVAGVVSLFSQDLASKIKLPNQEQVDHSFMGKVGNFAGTALGFVGGTALLRGVGMGATAARAAIGAVEGLAGSSEGSLWDKIKGAGIGALTAGAAGKIGDKFSSWVQKGEDTVLRPLASAGAPKAVTEGADRLMDAQVRSLVTRGKLADWGEMLPAAAVSTFVTETSDHIDHGIDKLVQKLPDGQVADSISRVLHAEQGSLARTGRFADSGVVISTALPDSFNRNVDRVIDRVSDSHGRFGEATGQFLQNEVNHFRENGRFVDPKAAFTQAAAREFSPEIDRMIAHTENMNNPWGNVLSQMLRTEADSLQQYGRLHNPGSALTRAVVDEVRPALDRFGNRLPTQGRDAMNDMLDGFSIDGMNGLTRSAERSMGQGLNQFADHVLADRMHFADHVDNNAPRVDTREIRA